MIFSEVKHKFHPVKWSVMRHEWFGGATSSGKVGHSKCTLMASQRKCMGKIVMIAKLSSIQHVRTIVADKKCSLHAVCDVTSLLEL